MVVYTELGVDQLHQPVSQDVGLEGDSAYRNSGIYFRGSWKTAGLGKTAFLEINLGLFRFSLDRILPNLYNTIHVMCFTV